MKKPSDIEEGAADETMGLLATPFAGTGPFAGKMSEALDLDTCVIQYDPVQLTSLSTLLTLRGSIFMQKAMWTVVAVAVVLAGLVAVGIVKAIERYDHINPESFSTETISSVIRSVTVAMAFLLGLFVNNAMERWWGIIKDFESLFLAAKQLVAFLIYIEADEDIRTAVARQVVLSIEMLRYEKIVSCLDGEVDDNWREYFRELTASRHMLEEERTCLEAVPAEDRSHFCWTLASKSIRSIDETHPRISVHVYKVVQQGMSAVSGLNTSSNFQFPFLYTHMLAYMVHLVNLLTATGAGITIGIVVARSRHDPSAGVDASAVFKEVLFLFIQVFLYQAFLGIGAALSFPVVPQGHGAMYRLPLAEMITSLRSNLMRMNRLATDKVL
jgi:hypothetical protein